MLLLTRDAPNNLETCRAFLGVPESDDLLRRAVVAPNLLVTRWLLDTLEPEESRLSDCSYLLERYDYARAAEWMERLSLTERRGPFFVVLFPSEAQVGQEALIALDAAPLKPSEMEGWVRVWRETLSLASADLQKTSAALMHDAGSTGGRLCDSVDKSVRVITPVVVAMAAAGLIAEYPLVVAIVGAFRSKDEGGAALTQIRQTVADFATHLGALSRTGCLQLISTFPRPGRTAKR